MTDNPQTTLEVKLPNYFVSFGSSHNHADYIAQAISEVLAPGDLAKAQQIKTLLIAFAAAIRRGDCS